MGRIVYHGIEMPKSLCENNDFVLVFSNKLVIRAGYVDVTIYNALKRSDRRRIEINNRKTGKYLSQDFYWLLHDEMEKYIEEKLGELTKK